MNRYNYHSVGGWQLCIGNNSPHEFIRTKEELQVNISTVNTTSLGSSEAISEEYGTLHISDLCNHVDSITILDQEGGSGWPA